jgi:tetratricopeptide (TPR) repeat protein
MKQHASIPVLCILAFLCQAEALSDKETQCRRLNNEGVIALNNKNWQLASDKFEAALKVDPEYPLARNNIIVMHGQHGLQLRLEGKKEESLREYHQGLYMADSQDHFLDEGSSITIQRMGKNPKSYADRVNLAEQARAKDDYIGAVVEYRAALELKNDAEVHKKLGDVYNLMGEKDKAAAEYGAAR